MSGVPLGYYYRLTKERRKGGPMQHATTYWHADPLCSFIQRGAWPIGPVPVSIGPEDPHVRTCVCFDIAGLPGVNKPWTDISRPTRGKPTIGKPKKRRH